MFGSLSAPIGAIIGGVIGARGGAHMRQSPVAVIPSAPGRHTPPGTKRLHCSAPVSCLPLEPLDRCPGDDADLEPLSRLMRLVACGRFPLLRMVWRPQSFQVGTASLRSFRKWRNCGTRRNSPHEPESWL